MAKKQAASSEKPKGKGKAAEMHSPAIPGTPAEQPPAGTQSADEQASPAEQKAAPKQEGPVSPIFDSRGTQFDPNVHATHADGVTPHVDSFGHFIQRAHHYDGAKKSHYSDTHRHA